MSKYYRTVIVYEALFDFNPEALSVGQVVHECEEGGASGMVLSSSIEEVTGPQMRMLLEAQGSDPDFLVPFDDEFDPDDQQRAYDEGWCVAECVGSSQIPDGWVEIQHYQADTNFDSDVEALSYVAAEAHRGSAYHQSALAYIDEKNFSLVRGK